MSDSVTAKQAQAIWTLLAAGGQGRMPAASVAPEALIRLGLIRKGYRAGSRTALAEVTDKGWAWADAHLGDPDSTPKALQPWLGVLKRYLEAADLSLAALFVDAVEPLSPVPIPKPKPALKPRSTPKPKPAPKPKPLTAPQLRKRIEAAYLQATEGRKNESVPLRAIREALADLDRATVDKGLARILKGDKKARLSQISDHRAVAKADHEAAFSPAGEPFHLLWIHA